MGLLWVWATSIMKMEVRTLERGGEETEEKERSHKCRTLDSYELDSTCLFLYTWVRLGSRQRFRTCPLLQGETVQPTGRDQNGEAVRMEGMLCYAAAARVSSGYRCRMKPESRRVLSVTQTRGVYRTWRP